MFRLEDLDLERLFDNLATRKLELAQYQGIVEGLEPGDEQDGWASEVTRVESEITELDQLISEKKEHDRGSPD